MDLIPVADTHSYLFYGDNLAILRQRLPDGCVDLCYIDPPFNSQRTYFQIYNNIGQEDRAQAQAFVDTWVWGTESEQGFHEILGNDHGRFPAPAVQLMQGLRPVLGPGSLMAYLVHMTLRITEIHRVLKPTGSFYLHCDPTASHYLKLICDAVFCSQGGEFHNEIVWHHQLGAMAGQSRFPSKHDIVFWYSKGPRPLFNKLRGDVTPQMSAKYSHTDNNGRYMMSHGKKYYLKGGKPFDDVWDIPAISPTSAERLGYPTQKPEALLERIIQASSNPGDTVLDAYCGCGTTVAVAQRLGRRWIGIDITYQAISLILKRLEDSTPASERPGLRDQIIVHGIPRDLAAARALAHDPRDKTRKEFEKWAILTYTDNHAMIRHQKGADGGVDGRAFFATGGDTTGLALFQVKSGHVSRGDVATLRGDMAREGAALGILLTLEPPTAAMRREAATAGTYHHPLFDRDEPRIRLVSVTDLLDHSARWSMPVTHEAVKRARSANRPAQQLSWT